MNKRQIIGVSADISSHQFGINASSRIIGATFNEETNHFEIEYYAPPFSETKDVYQFVSVPNGELHLLNNYKRYVFYGLFYNKLLNDYLYLLGRQVDRIK